ncbi:MAG: PLP-dependent transferase [Lachnospiraceae bacterium]|nr:PLP-dependent transferase [Lachnospiraceae bacterium]
MNTPIYDFVQTYVESGATRLHMPGHKGVAGPLGVEPHDITEIDGADVLSKACGIIAESEANAGELFGCRTFYSTEGSSLCIRTMVFLLKKLALRSGKKPLILAARNVHRSFVDAVALLDVEVEWIMPHIGESYESCSISGEELGSLLDRYDREGRMPSAVYVTSPDYLGNVADIAALAEACHDRRCLLMVDNAHGAYLRFLSDNAHPIQLGADICCDSAHKTLPVLTGGAYLHIHWDAPAPFFREAERAMVLFSSTSPSWLILQSLDRMNRELAGDYPEHLCRMTEKLKELKKTLREEGWTLAGDEPLKLTLRAADRGYTGEELHDILRSRGIECEFADREYLVMMPSADTPDADLEKLLSALRAVPRKAPLQEKAPPLPTPEKAMSIREAMFSPREKLPTDQAAGRVLADACVSCPPAVPVIIAGERITPQAAKCMSYYNITACDVVVNA